MKSVNARLSRVGIILAFAVLVLVLDVSIERMTGVLVVTQDLVAAVAHGGKMQHRHEKRLGRVLNNASLSCAWYKVCGTEKDGSAIKPWHLSYELTLRYCIKCNAQHYFLGKTIEIDEIATSNPLFGWMEKTGYE